MNRRDFISAGAGLVGAMALEGCAAFSCKPVAKFKLAMAGYTLHRFSTDEALAFCQKNFFRYLCVKNFHLPFDSTAAQIAGQLGIDRVHSQLLPGDKVSKVEELLANKSGGKLAFVGDGINDAPVLSRADIGIAMGAMGSDAAIEAADIVLMDDDPMKIAKAIRISRKCLGIVYQNIVFAIAVKLLALVLVAFGVANMWLAIFTDVGVMVLAVLNAIRAMFIKNL